MFVSSQVKKGGVKFKPGLKPKGPGLATPSSSSAPSAFVRSATQSTSTTDVQPPPPQTTQPTTTTTSTTIRAAAIGLTVAIEPLNKRVRFSSGEPNDPEATQSQAQSQPQISAPASSLKSIIKPTEQLQSENTLPDRDLEDSSDFMDTQQTLVVIPLSSSSRLLSRPPKITATNKGGRSISKPGGSTGNAISRPGSASSSTASSAAPSPQIPHPAPTSTPITAPMPQQQHQQHSQQHQQQQPELEEQIVVETEDDLRKLSITRLIRLQSHVLKPSRKGTVENLQKEAVANARRLLRQEKSKKKANRKRKKGELKEGEEGEEGEDGREEDDEDDDDDDAKSVVSVGSVTSNRSNGSKRNSSNPSSSNTLSSPAPTVVASSTSGTSTPQQQTRPSKSSTPATTGGGPRIQIIDGRIVIDDSSLYISAPDSQAIEDHSREDMEIVDESAGMERITSASFMVNKIKGKKWKKEDHDLFYKYLQYFGCDFELISHLFPSLTRRHIKMKYNGEERANPAKITYALRNRLPIPPEIIQEMKENHSKKISGVIPSNSKDKDSEPNSDPATNNQDDASSTTTDQPKDSQEKRGPSDPRNGSSSGCQVKQKQELSPPAATEEQEEETDSPTPKSKVFEALFRKTQFIAKTNKQFVKPNTKKGVIVDTTTAYSSSSTTTATASPTSPSKRKRPRDESMSPTRQQQPPVVNASSSSAAAFSLASTSGSSGPMKFKPSFKPNSSLGPKIPLPTPVVAPTSPPPAPEPEVEVEVAPVVAALPATRKIPTIGKGKLASLPTASSSAAAARKSIGKPIASSALKSVVRKAEVVADDGVGEEDELVHETREKGEDGDEVMDTGDY
ncbi:UNVERIFIED_CONTAM: Transcription factor TFIIIB component B [Siphonaria sp. JEL0065]|nr:Transcription factor TFIIIB component B [Siphonaria sp. JEL0065]